MALRNDQAKAIKLSDYRPPDFLIETVHLTFRLHESLTEVTARIDMRRNPLGDAAASLVLDGDDLTFKSAALDGRPLGAAEFEVSDKRFALRSDPGQRFTLDITTVIRPEENTQLMGLYRTSKTWCTQCEAEGFRRITYFLDRPDVLAVYTVRIEADVLAAPVLLSNGNLIESGKLGGGRHFAVWQDPHPKPSYLFALVAGDLAMVRDRFVTKSGRDVDLRIYVEHGKEDRCDYALDSLKRSMKWDEDVFGCEYDLDIFMIVAVSDFNMGAMENKGLNVFNDKYVLALPDTATDFDYANIEGIIAHEYFHNWTGNRITCRDWFQLCLKEGLTVYRDQEFSADMRSRPVKRIIDVRDLKARQFPEDDGPLAHPVRPQVYHEINNFYTATVYDKGAEVIRVLKSVIGPEAFQNGMDLYLMRHDGQAATIEQFVQCFADSSGRDLSHFSLWYAQAGTPRIDVQVSHDAAAATLSLDITQTIPPTPGQPDKKPMVIPLSFALIDSEGRNLAPVLADGRPQDGPLLLTEKRQSFAFKGIDKRPVVSLNRGFAAPIRLTDNAPVEDLVFLASHDTDPYNRWQAVQTLASKHLVACVAAADKGAASPDARHLLAAFAQAIVVALDDPALTAEILTLPSIDDLAREIGTNVDPDRIFNALRSLKVAVSTELREPMRALYNRLHSSEPFSPDAVSAGRRSLSSTLLGLLVQSREPSVLALAVDHYRQADNMTDRMAGLAAVVHHDPTNRDAVLADFYGRYQTDALITDKWLGLQAAIAENETLARVQTLMTHPAFSLTNPNRLRALIGAFAMGNPTQFHRVDGAGYRLLTDIILEVDPKNAQVAARLLTAFRSWRTMEPARRAKAEEQLRRIQSAKLSTDTRDIVERTLA